MVVNPECGQQLYIFWFYFYNEVKLQRRNFPFCEALTSLKDMTRQTFLKDVLYIDSTYVDVCI